MCEREKHRQYREIEAPKPVHVRTPQPAGLSLGDPEKAWAAYEKPTSQGTGPTDPATTGAANAWPDMLEDDDRPQEGLLKILIYLSFVNPAFTSILSIYALLAAFIVILCSPVTCLLLNDKPPLAGQIIRTLTPIVRLHLRLIDSAYVSMERSAPPSSASRLLLSACLSPGVAGMISLAGWVAIAFWIFASIIGEPTNNGRGREMEGTNAVRWVRNTWERWLVWSLR